MMANMAEGERESRGTSKLVVGGSWRKKENFRLEWKDAKRSGQ